ncbi:MAG: restriction endonuclease subunit S, partial [Paludibacter sp.]|nr:restriction endonuclease subunit S [Paludibacter sp.]
MKSFITQHIDLWTSAQATKTSGRGISASNQQLLGIQKLRELILELAVRGKLVPQNANDEPAGELLKRIEVEKKRLVKEGKIKKQEILSEVEDDEKLFELPVGWVFCRLGTIFNSIVSGGTPSKSNPGFWNGDIPWASVKDLGKLKYIEKTQDYITQKGLDSGSKLAEIDDVIICTRMGLGKIAIAKVKLAINQDLKAVKLSSNLDVDYFLYFFSTLKIIGTGTTVAGITQDKLVNYPFPLPPLPEQHRIVAKVDELMALCDTLEKEQTSSNAAHETLVENLLGILTNARDTNDFQEAWQRIAEYFDLLFTTEHSIDKLKQTILQLAVMGKLVPQNPNDEPASVLLKKIAAEKAKLVKEGKIKKQVDLPKITEEEKPFELPKGWEWVKCQDICSKITDGEHITPNRSVSGFYLLSARNVTNEGIILEDVDFVPADEFERIRRRCDPNIGDILISCSGSVGRVALVDKDNTYTMVRSAALIRPFSNCFDNEYLAI